ncbi:RHS repeat protein [Lysobacter sp. A6]|uniref:RHS repeat protein n=1 Tax=Noviluteimonas lactosilytica TaxID=2888523 RepID=A0ABS8JJQ1_9GAMM|nr:RHS repeat domain-containing protein [Lysobacter lactosilyticus]MCC8363835.1 RHS repeat protein [Lysobacter lactosilyticus]
MRDLFGQIRLIESDCIDSAAPNQFGNPVEPATGAKREVEIDFALQGEMALYVKRTYASFGQMGTMLGGRWRTNFEMSLLVGTGTITAYRNDGSRIDFTHQTATNDWRDKNGGVARIVASGSGYTLYAPDNLVETYDTTGRVLTQKNRRGVGLTFHYAQLAHLAPSTKPMLDRVVHTSGRSVQFQWAKFGSEARVVQVTDPVGSAYKYGYDSQGRLAST